MGLPQGVLVIPAGPVLACQSAVMADHNHTAAGAAAGVAGQAVVVVVVMAVLAGFLSEDYIALVVETSVFDHGAQPVVLDYSLHTGMWVAADHIPLELADLD